MLSPNLYHGMDTAKVIFECLVFSTVKTQPFTNTLIQSITRKVCMHLRVRGSLSIHCIGDRRMRTLNHQYRGKDKTTDVLSFAAQEGESGFHTEELGDIFISVPQIRRQARSLRISEKEEFLRMLIHGILHILGHDHDTRAGAKKMFGMQEKLLNQVR